jgi:HEAT repeat protein
MPSQVNPSRRRRLLIAAACILLVFGFIALLSWPEPEPRYENRTVTEWSLDLNSPYPEVRSNATVTIRSLGSEAVPPLVRQLDSRDSLLKRPFLALAPRLPVSWRRKFIRAMRPFEPAAERLAAVKALACLGTNAPVVPLLRLLRDSDRQLAAETANALASIGPASVPGFVQALEDPEPRVRALACYGLSRLGRGAAEAAPALVRRLNDRELQIASQAANALLQIGPSAVPSLARAVTDPDPITRYHAARTLGSMGYPARIAVPELVIAAQDIDPSVKREARNALRILAPDLALNDVDPGQN